MKRMSSTSLYDEGVAAEDAAQTPTTTTAMSSYNYVDAVNPNLVSPLFCVFVVV